MPSAALHMWNLFSRTRSLRKAEGDVYGVRLCQAIVVAREGPDRIGLNSEKHGTSENKLGRHFLRQ